MFFGKAGPRFVAGESEEVGRSETKSSFVNVEGDVVYVRSQSSGRGSNPLGDTTSILLPCFYWGFFFFLFFRTDPKIKITALSAICFSAWDGS